MGILFSTEFKTVSYTTTSQPTTVEPTTTEPTTTLEPKITSLLDDIELLLVSREQHKAE